MADFERKETKIDNTGVTETGAVVSERTSKLETKVGTKTTVVNVVWYIYGLFAFLLGIRMILKLLGANSGNAFVEFVYRISGILSAPFDNIFGVTKATAGTTKSVFEPSILVAIAVYAFIAWGIERLLSLNNNN